MMGYCNVIMAKTPNYDKWHKIYIEICKKKYRQIFEELRKEFQILNRQENNDRDAIKPYFI